MSSTELLFAKAVVALFGLTLMGLGLAAGRLVIRGGPPPREGGEEVPGRAEARSGVGACERGYPSSGSAAAVAANRATIAAVD